MWPNPQETADLVIFTEEILNGKLHFLCSAEKLEIWLTKSFYLTWYTKTFFGSRPLRGTDESTDLNFIVF